MCEFCRTVGATAARTHLRDVRSVRRIIGIQNALGCFSFVVFWKTSLLVLRPDVEIK